MSFEPSTPGLRASDADREAVVDRLHRAATEGRLDADELEERISAAYDARFCTDLDGLVADVTPPAAEAVRPVFVARPRRTRNGLAVASFVVSLLWAWSVGAIVAIVLGHVALRQIDASGGRQSGRRLAYVGLVLGYLHVLVAAILMITGHGWF